MRPPADAREYCERIDHTLGQQSAASLARCIVDTLREERGRVREARAHCPVKRIETSVASPYRETYTLLAVKDGLGVWKDHTRPDDEPLHGTNNGALLDAQFKLLCPRFFTPVTASATVAVPAARTEANAVVAGPAVGSNAAGGPSSLTANVSAPAEDHEPRSLKVRTRSRKLEADERGWVHLRAKRTVAFGVPDSSAIDVWIECLGADKARVGFFYAEDETTGLKDGDRVQVKIRRGSFEIGLSGTLESMSGDGTGTWKHRTIVPLGHGLIEFLKGSGPATVYARQTYTVSSNGARKAIELWERACRG